MINEIDLPVYKAIARKDLTIGCILFIQNPDGYARFIEESDVWNGFTITSATEGYSALNYSRDSIRDWSIIGHPIVLTDVLHHIVTLQSLMNHYYNKVCIMWDVSKPYYDQQSEGLKELVREIANLK